MTRFWHATRDAVGPLVVLAFCVNFNSYRVVGDGWLYFAFLQNLFGDPAVGGAVVYNFGLGILNAPFYAVGRAAAASGVAGQLSHALPAASVAAASIFYLLVAMLLTTRLVRKLDLAPRNLAVFLAVFGSPVWYYASFLPSYTHAADAAVVSLAAVLLVDLWREPAVGRAIAVGCVLGLAITLRPFNAGLVLGLCLTLFAYARYRDGLVVGLAATATVCVLLILPISMGASFTSVGGIGQLGFSPLTPFRMLFTDHRGLFVWTPATFLAVIGVIKLLTRRPRDGVVVSLTAMAVSLLGLHVTFTIWDAGWSFSARFLSSLLPFYAVGLAGLFSRLKGPRLRLVQTIAVVATVWSLFIGMNHAFGADQPDSATDIAGRFVTGQRTPGDFVKLAWSYSRVRHVVEAVF